MDISKYFQDDSTLYAYRDRKFEGDDNEYKKQILESSTIYVGELCTDTKEEQLWGLFGLCGEIRRVIMGVNQKTLIPCGFAFVEFYDIKSARNALNLNSFRLDGCYIKVDIDYGFKEGRQYGRGYFGNQIKDDSYRMKRMKRHF